MAYIYELLPKWFISQPDCGPLISDFIKQTKELSELTPVHIQSMMFMYKLLFVELNHKDRVALCKYDSVLQNTLRFMLDKANDKLDQTLLFYIIGFIQRLLANGDPYQNVLVVFSKDYYLYNIILHANYCLSADQSSANFDISTQRDIYINCLDVVRQSLYQLTLLI